MKLLVRYSLFALLSVWLVACKGTKEIAQAKDASAYLFLQQGGGITGKYESYKLYQDGRVEQINEGTVESTCRIDESAANEIFEGWNRVDGNIGMPNKPGNMNYRIEYHSNDKHREISWGDVQPVSDLLQEFFSTSLTTMRNCK